MNQKIKISQLPAKGSNLAAADLLEIAEFTGTGYISKSITGQEIIDAIPAPSVDWGDIGGTLSDQTDLNTALSGKVPTSRTLTINGTTQDLSADRTFTISTGITIGTTAITSGTVGRVLFEGTGNVVQESANLFWDATNNRLGVGTSTPAHTFQVYRNTSAGYLASFNSGATLNTNASLTVRIENANLPSLQGLSAGAGGFNTIAINPLGGNVLINTTTDAGFRLDVNGTARVQGQLTVSTGGASITGDLVNNGYTSSNGLRSVSSGALNLYNTRYIAGNGILIDDFNAAVYNNITHNTFNLSGIYTVNSGSSSSILTMLNITRTLNITAGTNTIRGIYYNPTLTSTVGITNHYAFHSTIGRIRFENLPTSAAGLSAGDIWNDAGTLKIV